MTRKSQAEKDEQAAAEQRERDARTEWRASADLYPPLPGVAGGTLPVPAYRQGGVVPFADVEKFGWHHVVYDAAEGNTNAAPDSAEAALRVHPLLSAEGEAAVIAEATGTPPGPPEAAQDEDDGQGQDDEGRQDDDTHDQAGAEPADDTKEA